MEINLHTISGNPNAMERELILALKKNAGNKERLNAEISIFKKILPVIESFHSFQRSFDFFDLHHNKSVRNLQKQNKIFQAGLENSTRYLAICKN